LQALFEESPMAIGFSRDGLMLDANPAYVRLFGYASAEEMRGISILEFIAPSHRERIAAMVAHRARGEPVPNRYQTRGHRKDGSEFPFEITTTRVPVVDGPLTIAFISDASEREQALEALRASEERFRTLASAAVEGVFVHADGKIILANEAGAAMYGYEPDAIAGAAVLDLTAPESRALVVDRVRRGATDPYEGYALRKDGTTFCAEVQGKTLSLQGRPTRVTIIRDVTERRRAEAEQRALAERVRHAQKLESLGVLAGGVAHDFNNILTVIANGVALVKRQAGLEPAAAAQLDAVALATERAADLCRQMLAYAGKAVLAKSAVDLGGLVTEMATMLEVSIGKKATLVRKAAPGLPPLLGDPTQIRQVVMNLVMNASEAIEGSAGTVTITTSSGTFGPGDFARSAAGGEPKAGTYVVLEVRDDGAGMDAATIAQMFDPFFTTKFTGRGLGMAAVLGIVRGHEGAIDVESAPGKGTRIRVFFPASAYAAPSAARAAESTERGKGVVLVVDDERSVRLATKLLLEDMGFEVLVAQDGVEALEVFGANAARIDAVLLDLTMPRMDGTAALAHLRRIAPTVPVVLTSGYGSSPVDDAPGGARPDAVLGKPYGSRELRETIARVMRRPG
jgi:PAS domain S-box-containing protein